MYSVKFSFFKLTMIGQTGWIDYILLKVYNVSFFGHWIMKGMITILNNRIALCPISKSYILEHTLLNRIQ